MYATQFYSRHDRYMENLSEGAQIVIQSMRRWHLSVKTSKNPQLGTYEFYRRCGLVQAAPVFHKILQSLSTEALNQMQLGHFNQPRLNDDELDFLQCLRLVQCGEEEKAAKAMGKFVDGGLVYGFISLAKEYVYILQKRYSLISDDSNCLQSANTYGRKYH